MDKYEEIFDNCMKDESLGEPMIRLQTAMREMNLEMIKNFPTWMKFNAICNLISMHENIDVDWNMVNNILNANMSEYDYNAFGVINSIEDLVCARNNCMTASLDFGPYRRIVCKKCNEEFTLTFGEVNFYQKREWPLPKQCEYCKKNIKRPNPISVLVKKEEPVEEKTAMQIALEKAGIK